MLTWEHSNSGAPLHCHQCTDMPRLPDKEKREAARILYLEGYSAERIAEIMKVSRRTITTWNQEGNWKERRVRNSMIQENSVNHLMEIFEFQVRCLKRKKDEMEESGELTPFKPGEFDALQKLYSTIKSDHRQFADYVAVMKELLAWLKDKNLILAQELTTLADEFLHEKHAVL